MTITHYSVQYPIEAAALLQQNENSRHSNIPKAIQCSRIFKYHKTLTEFDTITDPKMQDNLYVRVLVNFFPLEEHIFKKKTYKLDLGLDTAVPQTQ